MAKTTGARREAPAKTSGQGERRAQAPVVASAATLDRLIHERMRLAIVAELAVHPSLSFSELKRRLKTTDGNLSVHARRLEEAGYIACRKSFERRTQRTDYWLTPAGRAALRRYLEQMKGLIATLRA